MENYSGSERRRGVIEIAERTAIIETKVDSLENVVKEQGRSLKSIEENTTRLKTLIGAITFVISGLWLAVTSFKEVIVHWLTGR